MDVVNSTTMTFNSSGTISSNILTIDELIVIYSESPQNVYVFDDETMHPFDDMNIAMFDVYRNDDVVIKDGIENGSYHITWLYGGLFIGYNLNSNSISFY